MSRWQMLLGLVVMSLILASCKNKMDSLKPDPEPEALNVPPLNDARFSQPVQYPEDKLNEDPFSRRKRAPFGPGGPGAGPRGGSGMR